jgi:hypothetical protein
MLGPDKATNIVGWRYVSLETPGYYYTSRETEKGRVCTGPKFYVDDMNGELAK